MFNRPIKRPLDMMHVGGPNLYVAPKGLDHEPCRGDDRRQVSGPTGSKSFMVVADCCYCCGRYMRVHRDLTWQEYFWMRRWNARSEKPRDAPRVSNHVM